jgi:hypothetical protein
MSYLQKQIDAFVNLGEFLQYFSKKSIKSDKNKALFDKFSNELRTKIEQSVRVNNWFTEENIEFALEQWGTLLTANKLNNWLEAYSLTKGTNKKVAVIMAGNIPLVGFHDFISVLLTGNIVIAKQSTSDRLLLPVIASFLQTVEPIFKEKIFFTEEILKDFDAVIATGSNNTARYFDYYFRNKPNIIRKNRNSVAVLSGNETKAELAALGEDIFRYFGLGCRNVSKLFVPNDYDFDLLFNAIFEYKEIINHHKYANNYDYNKAVYLMSLFPLKDNGFLILKEDKAYASPIATVFYEYYHTENDMKQRLLKDKHKIQCVVSGYLSSDHIAFGKSQKPSLDTYADGIDTVDFLLKI